MSIVRTIALTVVFGLIILHSAESRGTTFVVNCGHAKANDQNPGTEARPLQTINRAAQRAQAGDTVLVRAGIYRERVAPARGGTAARPIVYTAAPGERVIIKGSEIWQPTWNRVDQGLPIYRGDLDAEMFRGAAEHPFRTLLKGAPRDLRLTLGQVFVDGRQLREVDNPQSLLATPGSWQANGDGTFLTIHFPAGPPPEQRLVEITTRQRIFASYRRGLDYIHVKGFVMEHCANQFPDKFWMSDSPQAGALGCRAGHHWLIEGNTIRLAKSIGIDCGYEGRRDLEGNQPTPQNSGQHMIRNNRITDNGCCGIAGMRSVGTQIVHNIIERNNFNHHTAPEIGGIKVHHFIDGRIEGNLIRDNDAHGIWVDNVYRNARIMRNLVVNNRGDGIFVELGEGPILIDNNVIAHSRPGFLERDPRGDGVYSHDASGITFAYNLVFGCSRFGAFHLKATERRRAGASRIWLLNNIFIDNQQGHINLPITGPYAKENRADHNLLGPGGDYLVNPWGGTPKETLLRSVKETLGRNPPLWVDAAPRLSLHDWTRVTGWGLLSVEAEQARAQIADDLVLTLDVGNAAQGVPTLPIAGIDVDYFGEPITQPGAIVGPFQKLTAGENVFRLWPPDSAVKKDL